MMNILPIDKKVFDKFGPYTLITGILLVVLGTAGILMPGVMSLSTVIIVAWLLLAGGSLWALHTYKHSPKSVMDWIKPALLFIFGSMMLFYPVSGVGAVGLLLAVYLFLDAVHSFSLARSIYPDKGWGWMTFNGVVSAMLASLFLIGWPATSLWLVGIYVSISLMFDGWALVAIGWALRKGNSS
jgi:uncharacterized membrane protein HdeD (DUF308 family)